MATLKSCCFFSNLFRNGWKAATLVLAQYCQHTTPAKPISPSPANEGQRGVIWSAGAIQCLINLSWNKVTRSAGPGPRPLYNWTVRVVRRGQDGLCVHVRIRCSYTRASSDKHRPRWPQFKWLYCYCVAACHDLPSASWARWWLVISIYFATIHRSWLVIICSGRIRSFLFVLLFGL